MISYLLHGKYYKGKCQMCALQYSYQPDSLLREHFFSPFSFRNTASVFLLYYYIRCSAFACSPNSGFFLSLFSFWQSSVSQAVRTVTPENWYNSALCSSSIELVLSIQVKSRVFRFIFNSDTALFSLRKHFDFHCVLHTRKGTKEDYSESSFIYIFWLCLVII